MIPNKESILGVAVAGRTLSEVDAKNITDYVECEARRVAVLRDRIKSFPHHTAFPDEDGRGLSLREYFAAHADIPWNAVMEALDIRGEKKPTISRVLEYRAHCQVAAADALIDALNADKEETCSG